MNKKRIIFCISSLSGAGGAERNISILANEIVKEDFDVTVLLIGNSENMFYSLNKEVKLCEIDLLRSKKVINTIEMVEKKGEKASMIMLGESVFSNIPFKGSKKAKIIKKGARLL